MFKICFQFILKEEEVEVIEVVVEVAVDVVIEVAEEEVEVVVEDQVMVMESGFLSPN
jgi:hypothetical protein